jgi:hypothetical protein
MMVPEAANMSPTPWQIGVERKFAAGDRVALCEKAAGFAVWHNSRQARRSSEKPLA